ncbi:TonB-dependent receptor plug domain-containing protein [Flavobacteriaceae bacterium Ap0902]|nr:TonB-dependent receptor plug domain-containing protein [Flavobacteriaceae bacterium Ap0902]
MVRIIQQHLQQILKKRINKSFFLLPIVFIGVNLCAQEDSISLGEVVFQGTTSQPITETEISTQDTKLTPSLTGSFTDILKTLPYVSVNTELSSQYMVRGGNFDENLVYVNGIEVYRPQLIRGGQQEGLNFLNPDMAANVSFSAGGWEAKYGDKMSSVLDVIYRRPKEFEAGATLSMMGGNLTVGGSTQDQKFSALIGARYLNRNLILNTLDGDTEFNPQSYDIQTNLEYQFNEKWRLNFIGNFAQTLFEQVPNTRTTNFGTLENPFSLTVFYDGREEDRYQTSFGTLSLHHKPSAHLNLTLDVFAYHTAEEEYFDIQGAYLIRQLADDSSGVTTTLDIGGQIDHARNDLDMLVAGIQHRGKYKFNANNNIEWGFTLQKEDSKDLLNEWQLIDSAGYNINPYNPRGNFYPGQYDPGDLELNYAFNAANNLKTNRLSGYLQYSKKWLWDRTRVLFNAGVRATYWDLNEELNISPRAQIALKPDWNGDHTFRLAGGYYVQPPFYKELRRVDGSLNTDIKSQKSIHAIAGHDYEFQMFDRPFKLSTEVYYKNMKDLIPYYLDNVRIRYYGENSSEGRAYGIDARLFGAFVDGADSWLSLSYGKVEEDIEDRGWISRPTDPAFKASLFFQDYMPLFEDFKVSTTLVYATGLPNGSPVLTDPYAFQQRLPDYKRVDIGLLKVFKDDRIDTSIPFLNSFKEFAIGLDIFNVFDIQNTVSNQWIRDVNSNAIYGVPNRLTGRFFNGKIIMKF